MSITVAMALLNSEAKVSGVAHFVYFALGAALAFSVLEALATFGFRKPLESEPDTVTALGVSLSLVSVSASTTVAWACAHFVGGTAAWPLTSFLVSVVYLVVAGGELAAADRAKSPSARGEPAGDGSGRGGP
ncbi:hypothetical protein [Streptomyces sp. YIM B13518]|uniref:hypothetical protein n=1 Tax=Streptomyces sp. YIM B13518 TaxID=3366316 RepID=UPI003694DE97